MKKYLIIPIIIISLLSNTFNISAVEEKQEKTLISQQEESSVKLTENQKKILSYYGISKEDMLNLSYADIEKIFIEDNLVNYTHVSTNGKETNTMPKELLPLIEKKGLSIDDVNAIRQRGYTFEEISKMSNEFINDNFGESITSTAKVSAPSGYNNVLFVPDGGGTNNYFNPSVNVDVPHINYYVDAAEIIYEHVFNVPSAPYGKYSYYMYGEWDGDTVDQKPEYGPIGGTHEGIDLKSSTSEKTVKSATEGNVIAKNIGGELGGYVQVYADNFHDTVTYMHTANTTIALNSHVSTFSTLGTQSTATGHIHLQVKAGYSFSMPTGKDDTLYCLSPYNYLLWDI